MPAVHVAEPHDSIATAVAAAFRARGIEPLAKLTVIDSASFLHDEACLLDHLELADAEAALVEDGIFGPREWIDPDLRAATKYGWAMAHALQNEGAGPVVWSVAGGAVATTAHELRFVVDELRQRGAALTHLDVCWPVALEPAIDLGEIAEAFLAALASYAPVIRGSGFGLFIPNAAGKLSVLPAVNEQLGTDALLDFTGLGWLEAARVLAQADAPLFRRVLTCAQQHFAFDKPRGALFTSEDDIHTLPDVPAADLAHVFLDDPRGRQLLHVTARSIFAAAELREPLAAFLAAAAEGIGAAISAEVERHLA